MNDLIVYVVSLASSLGAGALLQALGWRSMNAVLLPWVLLAIIAVLWLARSAVALTSSSHQRCNLMNTCGRSRAYLAF